MKINLKLTIQIFLSFIMKRWIKFEQCKDENGIFFLNM